MGLTFYPYGAAVALSAALSLLIAGRACRMAGLRAGTLSWAALLMLPLGFLGARLLFYVNYKPLIRGFFLTADGGFMLWGAALGALVGACLAALITRQSAGRLLDALAAPAALMIALCRLAEGLAGQGYGWYVADWFSPYTHMSLFPTERFGWAQRFPFAVMDMYEEWAWAVFVLEALLALAGMALLMRLRPRRPGWKALLLMLLYGASQIWCEAMREDAVVRWGFVRANQIFSVAAVAAALAVCCLRLPREPGRLRRVLLSWAGVLAGSGLVIAMEFAVEQKIVFLQWMTTDLCFMVLGLGCLMMLGAALPVWRRSGLQ